MKARRPKTPDSGEIAGWWLDTPEGMELEAIREGRLTGRDARRLAAWVAQWARWVADVERRERGTP